MTLPSPRRLAIYEIAAKNGVWILEDDYDHEYHYRCQPLASMAAEDSAEIVVYVSTLSKILFPSARLGFTAVPTKLQARFAAYRKLVTTQNDTMIQDAVARWIGTDGFLRHLNRTKSSSDSMAPWEIAETGVDYWWIDGNKVFAITCNPELDKPSDNSIGFSTVETCKQKFPETVRSMPIEDFKTKSLRFIAEQSEVGDSFKWRRTIDKYKGQTLDSNSDQAEVKVDPATLLP